jgi:hypothetical protein
VVRTGKKTRGNVERAVNAAVHSLLDDLGAGRQQRPQRRILTPTRSVALGAGATIAARAAIRPGRRALEERLRGLAGDGKASAVRKRAEEPLEAEGDEELEAEADVDEEAEAGEEPPEPEARGRTRRRSVSSPRRPATPRAAPKRRAGRSGS